MRFRLSTRARVAALVALLAPATAGAATITVPKGGDLQAALNAARPGDTILLAAGATYVGRFELPVHGGTTYITLRTGGADAQLPPAGVRISPSHAPYLAKLKSPDGTPALSTKAGAAFWRVMLVELGPNQNGMGDVVALGKGSTLQNDLSQVPHHLILDRVYVHGDRLVGQKRGIALNSGDTTIVNSYVSDIKAIGQDTQAIAGWNGPGPYHIENNYLEAAGNNFILGGDDPKIPDLVPTDLLFRGNVLSRPMSWRSPIVPTPAAVTAAPDTTGTLAAGTYAYRVVARRPAGTTTAVSTPSPEVPATVDANGSVTIRWNAVPDATDYLVYGRTPAGLSMYWRVTTTSFTDTGAAGTAGTPPGAGTVWQVKNVFELKNTRRAQVDYNLMENNWQQAQAGVAILLTVRNQYGGCLWCVVEDVTMEYNVVRNVGAGIKVLGIDPNYPSQQTNAIRIRNNEFSGLTKALGGNGYFLALTDNPRDITVDHNTIVSSDGSGIVTVTGPPVYGFVFTNNVARHNTYGIFGVGKSYGNGAISFYFPDGVVNRNVMAGGKASIYPAGNLFPTTTAFAAHFVDYPGGDFALAPGTDWAGAGTDGKDLGADIAAIRAARQAYHGELVRVVTETLPGATELETFESVLEASGGAAPYRWSILSGALPAGLTLDALTGALSGTATAAGDFLFTVRVADATGATAAQPLTLHVEKAIPPVQILTSAVADAVAEAPYAQHFEAMGGLGAYLWSVTAGTLPSGMSLSASGDLSGQPVAAGTWQFTVTAQDAHDASRHASRSFSLAVAPPPNKPPVVAVHASVTGVVPAGQAVTLTADATDVDGTVARVEFFVDGQSIGATTTAPFAMSWVAREGAGTVTAVAIDDDAAATTSAPLPIVTTAEVVIHAAEATSMVGSFQLAADTTAADGTRLWNPNKNLARVAAAVAAPASYAEFTFYAEAGRAYRLWIRGKGEGNSWANDSAYVQFSGTVTAAGGATARIGTTGSMWYSVEEATNAGIAGWGWQDNGFGAGVVGPALYFERTGLQTIRIQPREDGLSIDQIVISPARYLTAAPGAPKNDATVVAR